MNLIPTNKEVKIVQSQINEIKLQLNKIGGFSKVVAGGSTAKNTFLSGDTDIDLFIITNDITPLFNKLKRKYKSGKDKSGDLTIWNTIINGYDIDFVLINPSYTKKWFTLDHTTYYNKHLTKKQKDDVVILKALFKTGIGYGAENGGVTGVALEEAVRKFGSAKNVCKVILKEKSPFWVQDPSAKKKNIKRNLFASINQNKWGLMNDSCNHFIKTNKVVFKRPTAERFSSKMEKKGWTCVTKKATGRKDKDFQKGQSTCLKVCRVARSKEKEIKLCKCDAYTDGKKTSVCFIDKPKKLTKKRKECVSNRASNFHKESFKKKNPDYFIDKSKKLCVFKKRKFSDVTKYIKEKI